MNAYLTSGGGVREGVAHTLAGVAAPFVGGGLPVRLRAWDGSEAGPEDAPVVELRSPDALRRLLWHPGELGAAQAYVTGELEVHGDLETALTHAFAVGRARGLSGRPSPSALAHGVRALYTSGAFGELGLLGRPPAPPASQARVRGRLHSQLRDRRAISHHYDLSNAFYELILDPSMAYSCAYYGDDPDQSVESAQHAKLDLVCRKLGLGEGMTLLDVGCGWGSRRSRWASTSASATTRRTPRCCGARSARVGASWSSRCRGPASIPAAVLSSSRSSPPTCTCGRSARPSTTWSAAASRSGMIRGPSPAGAVSASITSLLS